MSTTLLNKDTVTRKWYVLDAAGKPMGKTAALAADLLRGKLKVTYTPHADCGDNVIIINASKAILTGNKMEQKYYRTHSGWIGGLKETKYRLLMQDKLRFCESCRDIRREFTQYCWNDSAHGDAPRKEHDHAMDDMRYFAATVAGRRSGGFAATFVER